MLSNSINKFIKEILPRINNSKLRKLDSTEVISMKKNQNSANKSQNNAQNNAQNMFEEFGAETDFSEVAKQNNKAEQNKQKASGKFAKNNQNNSN